MGTAPLEYQKALLALEDGTVYKGRSFTGHCESVGEVVFNTSMAGYQEILTDPSYCGQMVTMTYPLIGNYGINEEDMESERIQVRALLVKEYQEFPSNWRAKRTLADYLKTSGIPGLEGIDTRALTKHIREAGAMRAVLSTLDLDPDSLIEKARSSPEMSGQDLVSHLPGPFLWKDESESCEGAGWFEWPGAAAGAWSPWIMGSVQHLEISRKGALCFSCLRKRIQRP
jgi:carbamoyl-phosphate synthase small subunit